MADRVEPHTTLRAVVRGLAHLVSLVVVCMTIGAVSALHDLAATRSISPRAFWKYQQTMTTRNGSCIQRRLHNRILEYPHHNGGLEVRVGHQVVRVGGEHHPVDVVGLREDHAPQDLKDADSPLLRGVGKVHAEHLADLVEDIHGVHLHVVPDNEEWHDELGHQTSGSLPRDDGLVAKATDGATRGRGRARG